MTIQFDAIPDVDKIEDKFMRELAKGNGGLARRTALAVLKNSSEYYYNLKLDKKTGEAFLSSIDSTSAYIDLMKIHLEMMEAARARVFIMLDYHFNEPSKLDSKPKGL